MKVEEKDIAKQLAALKAEEVRAYKRAMFYTLIPVLVGLVVLGLSAWGILTLKQEAKHAREAKADLEASARNAEAHLEETKRALEEAKGNLILARNTLAKVPGKEGVVSDLNTTLTILGAVDAGQWVVISGDDSLEQAQLEAQKARKLGYKDVAIYLRQKSYRTLIRFSTPNDALQNLPAIRKGLSPDAYLRDLNKWCGPDPE